MKERDALMQKLIDINYDQSRIKKNEEEDELEAFMAENDKQIKKDAKQFLANRLNTVNEEIEKCNSLLALLMPSSFSHAKKAQPQKKVEEISNKPKPKAKASTNKEDNGLSSVFQKLSAMAKTKEKELKKVPYERSESELSPSAYQTPRFAASESGTDLVSMGDLEPDQHNQEHQVQENSGKSFFSEIVKNINPVAKNDSVDTSKYSNFVQEYNDFHKNKAYTNESVKRQKTDEEEESTVLRFGTSKDQ